MPPIFEHYANYAPRPAVRRSIERLLASLPPGHLHGLESIVLTDSASLSDGKTRRVNGRKYRNNECRGFYHPGNRKRRAWIEYVVDNMVGPMPRFILWSNLLTDAWLAGTVFHEVGHHLDATIGAPARTGERAADAWRDILKKQYLRRRYPVQSRIARLIARNVLPPLRRRAREAARHAEGSAALE